MGYSAFAVEQSSRPHCEGPQAEANYSCSIFMGARQPFGQRGRDGALRDGPRWYDDNVGVAKMIFQPVKSRHHDAILQSDLSAVDGAGNKLNVDPGRGSSLWTPHTGWGGDLEEGPSLGNDVHDLLAHIDRP